MGTQTATDTKPKWTKEEQAKIDEALREAALAEEIERQLREKRWSAAPQS
jgi:ABC-type cobalamin/Fe3+-siderophores transport system ATPase subunit